MSVFLVIVLFVVALPLLLLVAIAAGPVALVLLFIAGWALLIVGIMWLFRSAWRGRVGPPQA